MRCLCLLDPDPIQPIPCVPSTLCTPRTVDVLDERPLKCNGISLVYTSIKLRIPLHLQSTESIEPNAIKPESNHALHSVRFGLIPNDGIMIRFDSVLMRTMIQSVRSLDLATPKSRFGSLR